MRDYLRLSAAVRSLEASLQIEFLALIGPTVKFE
jgi:hypothetical protein